MRRTFFFPSFPINYNRGHLQFACTLPCAIPNEQHAVRPKSTNRKQVSCPRHVQPCWRSGGHVLRRVLLTTLLTLTIERAERVLRRLDERLEIILCIPRNSLICVAPTFFYSFTRRLLYHLCNFHDFSRSSAYKPPSALRSPIFSVQIPRLEG